MVYSWGGFRSWDGVGLIASCLALCDDDAISSLEDWEDSTLNVWSIAATLPRPIAFFFASVGESPAYSVIEFNSVLKLPVCTLELASIGARSCCPSTAASCF